VESQDAVDPQDAPTGSVVHRLAAGSLIVLIGPAGAGKSTWAHTMFPHGSVVSTDALRALVGDGEADQRANRDMFAVLDAVIVARVRRSLTTVIDSTALEPERRALYVELATRFGVPLVAVVFRASLATCLAQNAQRKRHVPPDIIRTQMTMAKTVTTETLMAEGFHEIVDVTTTDQQIRTPARVRVVPAPFIERQPVSSGQTGLKIELAISRFNWPGGAAEMRDRLSALAHEAEQVGVTGIWLMDHYRQIPQVGAAWEDLPELISTLGFLAGVTTKVRLGSLVASVSARSIPQLARSMATVDVLSGGRAICGIGAGWFEAEAAAVGVPLPPRGERFELLEDALQALPLFWGKGSPSFRGKHLTVDEALSYPRPLQARLPILVGGSGRRTLTLAAKYADAINVQGTPSQVRVHLDYLSDRLTDGGRSIADIECTHLGPAVIGETDTGLDAQVDALRGRTPNQKFRSANNAGTIEDHVVRMRSLAAAGVNTAIVSLLDGHDLNAIKRLAAVIEQIRVSGSD
jgi:alkanesulfonate monooxygenase SsuD/methylene tetrahydromethanopterin reductase-like flavin-dependent oxidoreductase (luciferase family)/predicted kinase